MVLNSSVVKLFVFFCNVIFNSALVIAGAK